MWLNSPSELVLRENEADVWIAGLNIEQSLETLFLTFLSPDEIHRAERFKFNRHRTGFIAARGILRSLVGRYLQVNPADVVFKYSSYGKPSVLNNSAVQFNISHSANLALLAFTRKRAIGVDLEYIEQNFEIKPIANRFFAPNEVQTLMNLPEEERRRAFFNCWTQKEAFIKAIGEGLSFPLNQFEVSVTPQKSAKLLAIYPRPKDVLKWSLYSLSPAKDFVGALALEGNIEKPKFWRWNESDASLEEIFRK